MPLGVDEVLEILILGTTETYLLREPELSPSSFSCFYLLRYDYVPKRVCVVALLLQDPK